MCCCVSPCVAVPCSAQARKRSADCVSFADIGMQRRRGWGRETGGRKGGGGKRARGEGKGRKI